MTIISATPGGSGDAYARLVQSLQLEFDSVEVGGLARQILESENADFHWDARVRERYLGQHFSLGIENENGGEELARIAILTFVAGRWNAGICLVDGDGCPAELLWLRRFEQRDEAVEAFERAR